MSLTRWTCRCVPRSANYVREHEGGNVAAGGNATAVGRLVRAIDSPIDAPPRVYDALDIPLRPAVGKLGR